MYRPMRQNKPRRVIHDVAELPVLCDCAEAGLLLRRNPEVIAKMAKEGVLKGAKQGQSWFFRRDDLVEYIRSAYVHDLYVLICDYKGVTVYVVVPDSFNRYAVLRRVLGHQLRFIPTAVSAADGAAIATPTLSSLVRFEEASPPVGLRSLGGSVSRPTAAP